MKDFKSNIKVREIVKKAFEYKTISYEEIKMKLQDDFDLEIIETLVNGFIEKGINIEKEEKSNNQFNNLEKYKFEEYVNYLNSLHNAGANNENAIAESQVKNKFYKEINIKRKTGEYLKTLLLEDNCTIILTGHAGDGKTSLLVQILNDLNVFKYGQELKQYDHTNIGIKKLFYVKDMSELSEKKQYKFLKKGIEVTRQNDSSIIIANTGPLIKNLKKYYSDSIEDKILEKMDLNDGEYLTVGEENDKVLIVNIAKIDNTVLIGELLDKLLNPILWEEGFDKYEKSFIFKNIKFLHQNIDNLKDFVTSYYKLMYENGERFTLRQIIAHLTFSITGNYLLDESIGQDFIKYNFANFFSGYEGYEKNETGMQIKSVKAIYKLGLDKKKTFLDEEIFINENFNEIDQEIGFLLEIKWRELLGEFNKYDKNEDEYIATNKKIRRMIRRFFIIFNKYKLEKRNDLKKDIFGKTFINYLKLINSEGKVNRNTEKMIFNSLFRIFTGHTPQHENTLYLTMKRDGEYLQNVQLIIGEIDKKNIKVTKKIKINKFSNEKICNIILYFKDKNEKIPLSYPILQYFSDMNEGVIKTVLDPHLSHGIDRIKSRLISCYSEVEDNEDEIKFFVLTNMGSKVLTLEITDNEIITDC
ncbi:MAG: hypothetical protein B6I28_00350 [Fusobacteriia bacterium 4572_132]|nr:MAG: hypothetical protein B6I28_00350 [Fusobacteriia bacterium 4572_132]